MSLFRVKIWTTFQPAINETNRWPGPICYIIPTQKRGCLINTPGQSQLLKIKDLC
jgi:hypothetical protein